MFSSRYNTIKFCLWDHLMPRRKKNPASGEYGVVRNCYRYDKMVYRKSTIKWHTKDLFKRTNIFHNVEYISIHSRNVLLHFSCFYTHTHIYICLYLCIWMIGACTKHTQISLILLSYLKSFQLFLKDKIYIN